MQVIFKSILFCILYQIINFPSSAQTINQTQLKLLENAYEQNDLKKLDKFFDNWHKEIPPISESELITLKPMQQETYKVFEAFYQPSHLENIDFNNIYKDVKYLLVQNSLKMYKTDMLIVTRNDSDNAFKYLVKNGMLDTILPNKYIERFDGLNRLTSDGWQLFDKLNQSSEISIDSIQNFRPKIDCEKKITLNLTKNYDKILINFLENNNMPLGTGGIMDTAKAIANHRKRESFMEHYVKIWYGQWGGDWQLTTYPEVYGITFNPDYSRAKIYFRIEYQGGEALLKKDNGKWIMVSSELTWTWIE
jgi:hypothetical protein